MWKTKNIENLRTETEEAICRYKKQIKKNNEILNDMEDFIYKTLAYLNILTDDISTVKKVIIEQATKLIAKYELSERG